ncbi:excalibur calcium-binding domain-containing protein [Plantactinospora sp. DSM 117369]
MCRPACGVPKLSHVRWPGLLRRVFVLVEQIHGGRAGGWSACERLTGEVRAGSEGDVHYANCAAVRAAGADPIRRGLPGYGRHLDRDGDGVGCE